jgi:hypothetical protein
LSDFVTRFPSTSVKIGELLSLIFIFLMSENYRYFLVCKAGPLQPLKICNITFILLQCK